MHLLLAFFLYGASFFYERIPHDQWQQSLLQYRAMGINTIDLYVMWNWHEPRPGEFDFTGRTNPQRDLVGLMKLIDRDGFKIVLRPGPVIRNEWRNGGYPAWLLDQPAYDMPLRDVLEGRYPATATLQNQHSDAAANQWLHNPLHMRYAKVWLQRVLQSVAPWRRDIVAIALDDDQGAYLDNDTWPAPHFHRYIDWLAKIVHAGAPGIPVFINTYDMKVTASAPVWAWSTWYQSDEYSIGEHDRSQIELAAGLLQTQNRPLMFAEFQAGWLQDADQAVPPPADPANTTLALNTLLQMGVHGIVNFPVQDTFNPPGWEAPWANAFYSWDAALSVQLSHQARYGPTAAFGRQIARYGSQLAQTHPAQDAAIAYLTSAYPHARVNNDAVAQIADATMQAQKGCHIMRITCGIVDLRYDSLQQLRRYPVLIVPKVPVRSSFISSVRQKLAAYRRAGGRIVRSPRYANIANPAAGGIRSAVLLIAGNERFGFLDVVNYSRRTLRTRSARVHAGRFSAAIPALAVAPRSAVLLPLGAVRTSSIPPAAPASSAASSTVPLRAGSSIELSQLDGVVLQNGAVRLIVSPCAGARAFVFEDVHSRENLFTTVGGLRDAWAQRLPPSPRDYIAKYTHPITTGTFNRCYEASVDRRANRATFTYTAPDAPPHGGTFHKTIALAPSGFTVELAANFPRSTIQRAQELSSIAITPRTRILRLRNGLGFFEPAKNRLLAITWPTSAAVETSVQRHHIDALVTLTLPAAPVRISYGVLHTDVRGAQAALAAFANRR